MNGNRGQSQNRNRSVAGLALLTCVTAILMAWSPGCSPNDPFDPDAVTNSPPTVAFFVGPVDPADTLRATSYFDRDFSWSGTDADGFVTEFYVSIRAESGVPAPWVTTTRTDTTMTFETGETGQVDAAFLIACRDDRGAVSDTLIEIIPMRNFPPEVGFLSDFDPEKNLQREFRDADGNVTEDGSAAADTIFWNWGDISFELYASDPDGRQTMDDFYRYTLAVDEPDSTYDEYDPRADPETSWVKVPFYNSPDVETFQISLANLAPGDKVLTVAVNDEGNSDSRFRYPWTVRAPAGPVLFIPDASSSITRGFYEDYLDQKFGEGGWDKYVFWKGFPEDERILLASMAKFEVVIWTDSGVASDNIALASRSGGLLSKYIDESVGGRLLLISKILTGGSSGLSNPFRQEIMGISPTGSPPSTMRMQPGKLALGQQPHLPSVTSTKNSESAGIGLVLRDGFDNEVLYMMEECRECYGDPRRPQPPYDPIVAMRMPARVDDRGIEHHARLVGISLQFDEFLATEVHTTLDVIFTEEFGVSW